MPGEQNVPVLLDSRARTQTEARGNSLAFRDEGSQHQRGKKLDLKACELLRNNASSAIEAMLRLVTKYYGRIANACQQACVRRSTDSL